MVLFHQAVEEPLVIRAPHLLDLHRPEFRQRTKDSSGVNGQRLRPRALDEGVVGHELHRRQLDMSSAVQHQQQTAADHITQGAVGLPPLPGFA